MRQTEKLERSGFAEVEHTADWAYQVWGQNREALFIQAAIGLYALAGVQLTTEPRLIRDIDLWGVDYESLLVAWLNELLYLRESENLGFDQFEILRLDLQNLKVRMGGAPIQQWSKLIKAATYHDLSIRDTDTGVETTLVLDV
jgi:SHS2 domain-containing protein